MDEIPSSFAKGLFEDPGEDAVLFSTQNELE